MNGNCITLFSTVNDEKLNIFKLKRRKAKFAGSVVRREQEIMGSTLKN